MRPLVENALPALALPTPIFLTEQALDRLVGEIPPQALADLREATSAFQAWVAQPALRMGTAEQAVAHVLGAAGSSVSLRVAFARALASVPDGPVRFLQIIAESLGDLLPPDLPAPAREAADGLQRAQATWARLMALHPRLGRLEGVTDAAHVNRLLTAGLHADTLLLVVLIGLAPEGEPASPEVVRGIAEAAAEHARAYHRGVRTLAESLVPPLAADAATTVDDLLALPPFDGPARSMEEIQAAAIDGVGSR